MIDTHVHIIPGVDDGAENIEVSIKMIQESINQGVTEIIATPHYYVPMFTSTEILSSYNKLVRRLQEENIDIKLHLGNEVHLNEETLLGLEQGKAKTLGDSNYLLIELPDVNYYPFHEAMLFDLRIKGYNVLLAHIERYKTFRNQHEKVEELVAQGVYCQLSSKFIIRKKSRHMAFDFIKKGCVHVVASDGHNLDSRPIVLKDAYDIVKRRFGETCANTLFIENPKRILEDKPLKRINVKDSVYHKVRNTFIR